MATSQYDGDGYDAEDGYDAAMDEAPQTPASGKQGAMNPKRQASLNRELRRNQAYASARTESIKANTDATKQATAAKANEMANQHNAPGTSFHRNEDGTYTKNAPLSPDKQDGESDEVFQARKSSAMASAVAPSRLDAFQANQSTQTANEKLNGIAAGAGGNSWDANNPQNEARAAKIAQAVQSVKDAKTSQGIDPSTNEYVGTGGGADITASVRGNLDQSAAASADASQGINSDMASAMKSGDMAGAVAMQPGAIATNRAAVRDTNISNSTNNVTMTPYGVVATSDKPLGTGGLERLMATPAVQSAAKNTNAPAAMAAVSPTQAEAEKTGIAAMGAPRQVKQTAQTRNTNPLFGAVSPKPKKELAAA